jgi:DNA-directed RNA polymerase specialized sigma24 family protein
LSQFRAAPESSGGLNTYLRFVAPIARRALLSTVYASRAQEREQLDRWLTRLRSFEPLSALMVDLRYFAGLSVRETAEAADVSVETALQDLRFAKSWLAAYRSQHIREPP